MPAGSVITLRLEDLVEDRREESFFRLSEFLGGHDAGMQSYFRESVSAERANIGRWRRGLSSSEQASVTVRYAAVLGALVDDEASGVSALTASLVSETASTVDGCLQ